MTKLYTGTGDAGYTSLLGKERIPKYDPRPQAYGTLDEATSFMGLGRAAASERTGQMIVQSQRDLWIIMGELAADPETPLSQRLAPERTAWLEQEIAHLDEELPPLKQFVLPGNTLVSGYLDVARTVVRRAERQVARLLHEDYIENEEILRYLNRLSSLLFALARYEEYLTKTEPSLVHRA